MEQGSDSFVKPSDRSAIEDITFTKRTMNPDRSRFKSQVEYFEFKLSHLFDISAVRRK